MRRFALAFILPIAVSASGTACAPAPYVSKQSAKMLSEANFPQHLPPTPTATTPTITGEKLSRPEAIINNAQNSVLAQDSFSASATYLSKSGQRTIYFTKDISSGHYYAVTTEGKNSTLEELFVDNTRYYRFNTAQWDRTGPKDPALAYHRDNAGLWYQEKIEGMDFPLFPTDFVDISALPQEKWEVFTADVDEICCKNGHTLKMSADFQHYHLELDGQFFLPKTVTVPALEVVPDASGTVTINFTDWNSSLRITKPHPNDLVANYG